MTENTGHLRFLWNGLGFVALSLGVIGIPLPVLPTTPFVILAAYFFSKGSPRYSRWIQQHKYFGPMVQNWMKHRSISMRSKILATVLIVVALSIPFYFMTEELNPPSKWATLILVAIGWCYIMTRPNGPQEE
ncbi:MAG: YbaN family protein [Planctomycetota bacterium]|nr:YbaN family protein [Planctomycetota bacterium]